MKWIRKISTGRESASYPQADKINLLQDREARGGVKASGQDWNTCLPGVAAGGTTGPGPKAVHSDLCLPHFLPQLRGCLCPAPLQKDTEARPERA